MPKLQAIILLLFLTLQTHAQNENRSTISSADSTGICIMNDIQPAPVDISEQITLAADSLQSVATLHQFSTPLFMSPYRFSLWMPTPMMWGMPLDLHEGFNAQLDMGVMVGFGKHNPFKGASFFTDVTLAYVHPLDNHWTLALGGTLSRFKMWNEYEYSADIFAIANYRFNDHWSASAYVSYNHLPQGTGFLYGVYTPEVARFNENFARIGGEVTYKFNENFSVSVGVSTDIPTDTSRPWKPQHSTEPRNMIPATK